MNQQKFDALVRLGYKGTMQDMERLYYAQGVSYTVALQDAEHAYLRARTTAGANKDMWRAYLSSLGYSGSYNDQAIQFWNTVGISTGPAVSSVTSATQNEGTSLVHTVTLASAVSGSPANYTFSIGGGTATSGTDYTATPTFSNSVTRSGGTITVPVSVTSFTITVSTTDDAVYEGTETYSVSVGGVTNTGTISDNESAPTVTSVSSNSATEGSNIVHTVAITGTAQASRTYAFAFSGAAVGGVDYNATPTFLNSVTLSGGNITVPSGVTSFTVTVATINNGTVEGSRAYTMTIGGASGTGTVNDDEQPPFYLNLSNAVNATISDSQGMALAPLTPVGSGTLTLSVDESVASGVAPLAVFFDATASTSTETTRPFHDVSYYWEFGDTSAGTWSNGTGANTSRDTAFGPVAAHMFETAGTYTVTLTAHDGVSTTTTTKTITVTAADTEWAGAKTICYSTGAAPVPGVNGVPTGATCVGGVTDISASYAANKGTGNKRHLLKAGDTFAIASSLTIDVGGPSMIGKFGSGADPIISSTLTATSVIGLSKSTTPTGVSDWRFQDFTIDCTNQNGSSAFASNGSYSKMLMNRVYMTRCGYGLLMSGSTLNALNTAVNYTHAMWDQVYMVDSTIYDLYTSASGPNAIFANSNRAVVMGCNINTNGNGEHGIRFQYCNRAVFNNNTIQGIATGKHNITVRGSPYAGDVTQVGPVFTEKVVISDNKLIGGVSTAGMVKFSSQNGTSDERGRDIIVERNWFDGSSSTGAAVQTEQPFITIRNNVIYMPSGSYAFTAMPGGLIPSPDKINIYNNTIYTGKTSGGFILLYSEYVNDAGQPNPTMSGAVFEVKNNILYTPSTTGTIYLGYVAGGSLANTVTQSNNSSSTTTSPLLAANPATALAHFTPGGGSYAQAGGTNVKNWKDLYGTTTQATPDIGAVVIA